MLNETLATNLDLKTQVKQAHWNVKGMQFYQLHQRVDAIATQLDEYINALAQRVTALGGVLTWCEQSMSLQSFTKSGGIETL